MRIKDFNHKVALITGGSSGIGLAVARLLAARGAHVWLLARRENLLEDTLASVQAACGHSSQRCGYVCADVSDYDQVEKAVAMVTDSVGVPDLVINSAGVTYPGYVEEIDLETFRTMMDVNYFGTVYTTRAVLDGMIARGSGYIVNLSSVAGFVGTFGYSAYGASKYAVRGFSDVLRAEMKPHGIGVAVVFPPDTDTPMLDYETPLKPPETKALAGNVNVMSAEEVANSILKGLERGRYLILPGFETQLLYRLNGLLGNLVYKIMDIFVARAKSGDDSN
jgi:3-dehydrosphinganine reductase